MIEWGDLLDDLIFALLLSLGAGAIVWFRDRGRRKAAVASAWGDDLWDRSPMGVALLDYHTGMWLRVNPEVERILGYTSAELTNGMTWMEVTTKDTLDSDTSEVERVWNGEQSRYTMDKAYCRKSPPEIECDRVEVRLTVTTTDFQGETFFLVFIEDRSEEVDFQVNEAKLAVTLTGRLERALETVEFERERAASLLREVVRRREDMGDPNTSRDGDGK